MFVDSRDREVEPSLRVLVCIKYDMTNDGQGFCSLMKEQ